jgi:hypothetical protein
MDEFLDSMGFILCRSEFNLTEWVRILTICSRYCIEHGVNQAISAIRSQIHVKERLAPTFKLRVAWELRLTDLYDEFVRELLSFPFVQLRKEDYASMGPAIAVAVHQIRDRIMRHRSDLVSYVPSAVHADGCPDHGRCGRDWSAAYSTAMLFYTNTRRFYTGRQIFEKIENVNVPSMYQACRAENLEVISAKGVLWREEEYLEMGVEAIKNILGSDNVPFPRPDPHFIVDDAEPVTQPP